MKKNLTDFFIGNGLMSLCSAPQGFDVWRNWYFKLHLHHSRAVILKLKMLDRSSFANCLARDTLSTLLKPAPICSSHCLSPSIAKPGSELRNGESSTVSFSDIPSSKQPDLFLERRINGKAHNWKAKDYFDFFVRWLNQWSDRRRDIRLSFVASTYREHKAPAFCILFDWCRAVALTFIVGVHRSSFNLSLQALWLAAPETTCKVAVGGPYNCGKIELIWNHHFRFAIYCIYTAYSSARNAWRACLEHAVHSVACAPTGSL